MAKGSGGTGAARKGNHRGRPLPSRSGRLTHGARIDLVATLRAAAPWQPLPKAEVITMGMILHDWNLEKKMHLIRAAYDALPPGGALVAIEALIAVITAAGPAA